MTPAVGVAIVMLPLAAGLHRFAVSYGYRGVSFDRARAEGLLAASAVMLVETLTLAAVVAFGIWP